MLGWGGCSLIRGEPFQCRTSQLLFGVDPVFCGFFFFLFLRNRAGLFKKKAKTKPTNKNHDNPKQTTTPKKSCFFFYKKQTGPRSTPNSCSGPPMSIGAMSTMGRREVFCERYSMTVLPHFPVCFWGKNGQKWDYFIYYILAKPFKSQTEPKFIIRPQFLLCF